MRIHRNTVDNDWQFGHSQADFLVDCHAGVIQNIKTKLQEWKYNFFGNLQAGIDYRTRLGKRGQRQNLDTDIKDIITSPDEVLALTKYESFVNDRELTANFSIYDMYSQEETTDTIKIGV